MGNVDVGVSVLFGFYCLLLLWFSFNCFVVLAPISRGVKCKICKLTVHIKCQSYIAYCAGVSLCVHVSSHNTLM